MTQFVHQFLILITNLPKTWEDKTIQVKTVLRHTHTHTHTRTHARTHARTHTHTQNNCWLTSNYYKWWSWEVISNTRTSVWSSVSKHLELSLKNSAAPRFQLPFSVFGNMMKHLCECLIYYVKHMYSIYKVSQKHNLPRCRHLWVMKKHSVTKPNVGLILNLMRSEEQRMP